MNTAKLYGIGVGPGDPELLTLKAVRILGQCDVVAYFSAQHGKSNARAIVADFLTSRHHELAFSYPVTTEKKHPGEGYEAAMRDFYDASASAIANELAAGRQVAILCEGDPMFYGSYMYLHDRLAPEYPVEVIPGICSVMAASARLGKPLVRRDTPLTILPGTLAEDTLVERFQADEAYVILKLGRNFAKVRRALLRAGIADRAAYIERATMTGEAIYQLDKVDEQNVPYFSLIVVGSSLNRPLPRTAHLAGRLAVVGLGPGDPSWCSSEVREALGAATDVVGYQPYLDRVPVIAGQNRHGSDNKVELDRARHALRLSQEGANVCVVSSGDPGIFAMASAIMEAIEYGDSAWRDLDIRIMPGISAMQAAAARVGAPLGHDFCVMSLSDRLKPWDLIAQRLEAAAASGFAIALYNPVSSQRRRQIHEAQAILAAHRRADVPVVIARDVGGAEEEIIISDIGHFVQERIDMRTVVLVGSNSTRLIPRSQGPAFVYTPRSQPARV